MQVLRYLGRYTHRVAISNHRLLACDQECVTFRWKDYARGGRQAGRPLLAPPFGGSADGNSFRLCKRIRRAPLPFSCSQRTSVVHIFCLTTPGVPLT